MYIPISVLAGIALAFVAMILIALRRRGSDRNDLTGPPRQWAPPPPHPASAGIAGGARPAWFTPEFEARVRTLLPRNKIQAIKIVREASHMGLAEAKDFVERM